MGTSPTMSRSEELGAFPIKKLVSLVPTRNNSI